MLTLNELSDDYENLTVSIMPGINRDAVDRGMAIEKSEVVEALKELVELRWATAWQLGNDAHEFARMPSLEEMEDPEGAWFYITDAGRTAQSEFDGWPFDERGEMRKDWTPPGN
jgi:hypothetical protein